MNARSAEIPQTYQTYRMRDSTASSAKASTFLKLGQCELQSNAIYARTGDDLKRMGLVNEHSDPQTSLTR